MAWIGNINSACLEVCPNHADHTDLTIKGTYNLTQSENYNLAFNIQHQLLFENFQNCPELIENVTLINHFPFPTDDITRHLNSKRNPTLSNLNESENSIIYSESIFFSY